MRNLFASLLVVTMSSLITGTSYAQTEEDPDYARPGAYLGLSWIAGISTKAADQLEKVVPVEVEVDSSIGLLATAGYRFAPHFAAEVQFEWLDEYEITIDNTEIATLSTWATTINGKGFLLTGAIQPFVLVGVGAMDAEIRDSLGLGVSDSTNDFAAKFGGGLDLYVSPHVLFNLGASYVLPTGDLEDLDYVSVGAGIGIRF